MYDLLTFSELFLNKEVITSSEFQNLRPIFLLEPPGYQLLSYGKAYQAKCDGPALVNDHTFDCVPLPASTNINQNVDTSKLSKSLCDFKLYDVCPSDNFRRRQLFLNKMWSNDLCSFSHIDFQNMKI
jgi:hypothetical protein